MSGTIRIISCVFLFVFLDAGCEQPQQPPSQALQAIQGITLADLQAEQPPLPAEPLLAFSVLTYMVDADAMDSLQYVIDSLSKGRIRYDHVDAFAANGLAVGCGTHEQGAAIAQRLHAIGAVRTGQRAVLTPPGSHEILSRVPVTQSQAILFFTSATGAGGMPVTPGKLGWILSAAPVTSVENTAQVMLCPAFWKPGASDLRMLTGQEPFEFRFFDVCRIRFPMQTGQFCLLAPVRAVKERDTLDRFLFEVPGRDKVIFFVIIYGGLQQIDNS